MKCIVFLWVLLFACFASAADRAVLIFLQSGDAALQRRAKEFRGHLTRELPQLGFSLLIFDENSSYGKQELADIKAEPEDRLWVFLFGHVQTGRNDLYLKLPKGVIAGAEFASLLDKAGGKQMVFCFTGNGRELQDLLAAPGRVTLSPVSVKESKNPPEYPRFLLPELAKAGSFLPLLREAAAANQEYAKRERLYLNEVPRLTVGEAAYAYPFAELDEAALPPLRKARRSITPTTRQAAPVPAGWELYSPESEREVIVSADGAVTEVVRDSIVPVSERAVRDYRSFRLPRPAHALGFELKRLAYTNPGGTPGKAAYDERTQSIHVPELAPGGRIDWEYSFRTAPGKIGAGGLTFYYPLGSIIPKRQVKFSILLPRQPEAKFAFYGIPSPAVEVKEERYGTRHTLEFTEVPAFEPEQFMFVEDMIPAGLTVSTVESWEALTADYAKTIEECDKLDSASEALAERLAAGETEPEKILAKLYDYINEIRYNTTPIGVRAVRPRLPGEMFATGYGDCKDKANALVAMARKFGIDGCFVLVNRGGRTDVDFPGWQFNHAVAYFPDVAGGLWLDPTDPGTPFRSLPPGDNGRMGLLIRPGKAEFRVLKPAATEENLLELTIRHPEGTFLLQSGGLFLYQRKLLDHVNLALARRAAIAEIVGMGITQLDDRDPARITGRLDLTHPFRLPRQLTQAFLAPERKYALSVFDGQPFRYRLKVQGLKAKEWSWRSASFEARRTMTPDGYLLDLNFLTGRIEAGEYPAVRKAVFYGETRNE